jgi:hypothetical protein
MPKRLYVIIAFFAFVSALVISLSLYSTLKKIPPTNILGIITDTKSVSVTTSVKTTKINFKVYPENRIPQTNNWSNTYEVTIENCTSGQRTSLSHVTSDNQGNGSLNLSFASIFDGQYRFIFQGMSHLRTKYNCYQLNRIEQSVDLTLENKLLKAGEISDSYDNYINALDLSVLINNLHSTDIKADLNRDNIVNALDLSILVNNIFLAGD